MEIYIAKSVAQKLKEKHKVRDSEVYQCFKNRTGKYAQDIREKHQTDPPTLWFISQTDTGRHLKVILLRYSKTEVIVKSAYEPNTDDIRLYQAYLERG